MSATCTDCVAQSQSGQTGAANTVSTGQDTAEACVVASLYVPYRRGGIYCAHPAQYNGDA